MIQDIIPLSHTSLESFRSCPRLYQIRSVKRKAPQRQPVWAVTGSMCHAALLTLFKTSDMAAATTSAVRVFDAGILNQPDDLYVAKVNDGLCIAQAICHAVASTIASKTKLQTQALDILLKMAEHHGTKYEESITRHRQGYRIAGRLDMYNNDLSMLVDLKFVSSFRTDYLDNYYTSTQLLLYEKLIAGTSLQKYYILIQKLARKRKKDERDDAYISRLADEYTKNLSKYMLCITPTVKDYDIMAEYAEYAEIIRYMLEKDWCWQNRQHCSFFGGCAFRDHCHHGTPLSAFPSRTDSNA